MKLYALSDIHGRTFSLQQFVDLGFEVDNPHHHIVFLGDYFDRYENNHEVYLEILEIQKLIKHRCHLIIGNHDAYMKEFIEFVLANNTIGEPLVLDEDLMTRWRRNGADITLEQCFHISDLSSLYNRETKSRLLMYKKFVDSLQDYVEIGNIIFTHAGIDENYDIDYWTRDLIHHDNPFSNKEIVIGHSPFRYCLGFDNLQIVSAQSYIGQRVINKDKKNHISIIDNGEGNNIVLFKVKTPREKVAFYGEV